MDRIAQQRRRPVTLQSWDFGTWTQRDSSRPTGLWIPSARADWIFYSDTATAISREQTIGHELGHLLLGHTPRLGDAPPELLTALTPALPQDLARDMLAMARTGYEKQDEALVEEFGTTLIRFGATLQTRQEPQDELGRLTDSLR
ncbi:ImmA/IrrE family metallo-endopeptidase [Nakamurella endophytica]|uniref:ImmA/IrrE family metallo-endopeptidase n=1 Tax=Nakamurella endophytica TaxID=1748367 RepID=UPI0016652363|nr:ImmA/IrrE family metallo-endopeptidase [Nakamurella endophytica]